jgi:hypothetical protein
VPDRGSLLEPDPAAAVADPLLAEDPEQRHLELRQLAAADLPARVELTQNIVVPGDRGLPHAGHSTSRRAGRYHLKEGLLPPDNGARPHRERKRATSASGERDRPNSRHLLCLVALAAVAAACGSSTSSTIERAARAEFHAASVKCHQQGMMLFVGKRENVYECRVHDIPPAYRPFQYFDRPTVDVCFVRANGSTVNVTDALTKMQDAGANAGAPFACTG